MPTYTELLNRDLIALQRNLIREQESKHHLALQQVAMNRALLAHYRRMQAKAVSTDDRSLFDKRAKSARVAITESQQLVDELELALPLMRQALEELEAKEPQEAGETESTEVTTDLDEAPIDLTDEPMSTLNVDHESPKAARNGKIRELLPA